MSLLALVVAIVLFLLAALTDGVLGGSPLDLIAVGLAAFALSFAVGSIPPTPRP